MNCTKIEKVLREQTINMFSKEWYQDTALLIVKNMEIQPPRYGQVILNFSISEFQKLNDFFETLELNRIYTNKDFLPMVASVIPNITPKRVRMELKRFATSKKLYIKEKNASPIGRTFVLLKDY